TSASTDIETFPIEAGSFIDRLRRGRDDEVGGLDGNRRKSGDGNAEQKNTCRHLSLLGSRSGHHYLRRSVVTIAWTPSFPRLVGHVAQKSQWFLAAVKQPRDRMGAMRLAACA